MLSAVSLTTLLVLAFILRLALILYGEWQDQVMLVKYTDIDYSIFTDAARYVTQGESPYKRLTYRYTPLLAWMLTPNIWLHHSFGKLLFCTFDLVAGVTIYCIVGRMSSDRNIIVGSICLWLFNPLTLVVSSRGNAESIMAMLVLATLHQFLSGNYRTSAFLWAVSVHFKIYPITYAIPIYLKFGPSEGRRREVMYKRRALKEGTYRKHFWEFVKTLFPTKDRMEFFLLSLATFVGITGGCYLCYGWEFLHETYLYHLTRSDTRHNFSPFFYLLYLTSDWVELRRWLSLIVFIPQAVLLVAVAIRYYHDLPFCCFLQTFVFVSFNKVCTSQYFLWYLTLLPLILPSVQMSIRHAGFLTTAWFTGQAIWLYFAYLLEFEGQNTFFQVWLASILFFLINCFILRSIMRSHKIAASDEKIS